MLHNRAVFYYLYTFKKCLKEGIRLQQRISYVMIKINKIQVENMANTSSTFLDEIKQLFNQPLQQNSAVFNLVAVEFTIDIIR